MIEPLSASDYFWTQVNVLRAVWPFYLFIALIGAVLWWLGRDE